jgi:chaperonin GroEL (HSP60 family)
LQVKKKKKKKKLDYNFLKLKIISFYIYLNNMKNNRKFIFYFIGGGAIEMELSKQLRNHSKSIKGKI